MKKSQLREAIKKIIQRELKENQPAPSKPKDSPGPAVAPGKPGEKPGPRRPLGNPDVKPKPKATMGEADMLAKIVKRFKSKKDLNELGGKNPIEQPSEWEAGYKAGYGEGYKDASGGKINKFNK